ncbi:MAG: flagellar motor switch protein FliG, partial [Phycisphaeraceae bacterium]
MARSDSPNPTSDMPGVRKAAVLLLTLDQEASTTLLKQLPGPAVEEVTRELASLGNIPKGTRDQILKEFYDLAVAQTWASEGGLDYARALLQESLDPKEADRILQQISTQVRRTPFSFLQKAESTNLLTF